MFTDVALASHLKEGVSKEIASGNQAGDIPITDLNDENEEAVQVSDDGQITERRSMSKEVEEALPVSIKSKKAMSRL